MIFEECYLCGDAALVASFTLVLRKGRVALCRPCLRGLLARVDQVEEKGEGGDE